MKLFYSSSSFGAGCWAENECGERIGNATSCTGCGEDIILGSLAKEMSTCLQTDFIDESMKKSLESCKSHIVREKKVGLITLSHEKGLVLFGFAFTTQGLGVGWFSSDMKDPIVRNQCRFTLVLHQNKRIAWVYFSRSSQIISTNRINFHRFVARFFTIQDMKTFHIQNMKNERNTELQLLKSHLLIT